MFFIDLNPFSETTSNIEILVTISLNIVLGDAVLFLKT